MSIEILIIALFFALGIIFYDIFPFLPLEIISLPCVILSIGAIWILSKKYNWQFLVHIIIGITAFILGYYNLKSKFYRYEGESIKSFSDTIIMVLKNIEQVKDHYVSIRGYSYELGSNEVRNTYLKIFNGKEIKTPQLSSNDTLIIKGWVIPLTSTKFLSSRQRKSLLYRGFSHYILSTSDSIIQIRKYKGKITLDIFSVISSWIIDKVIYADISQSTKGAFIALLIGDRTFLPEETVKAFMVSGLIHVLAISGMHVGLIYGFILFIYRLFGIRENKILWGILPLIIMWFYSGLCGWTSSVVRASAMLSLFTISNLLQRNVDKKHILLVSFFLHIVINPKVLFQPGFQLSYSAMLGIFLFFNKIRNLIPVPWFLVYFRDILAVTLSAQLLTIPVILYHFGTISTYSILSNLVFIIPLTLFIYGVFVLALFLWLPDISFFLFRILDFIWSIIEQGVQFIAGLPGSIIGDIYIDGFTLLYLLIFLILIFLENIKSYLIWFFILIYFIGKILNFVFGSTFINISFQRKENKVLIALGGKPIFNESFFSMQVVFDKYDTLHLTKKMPSIYSGGLAKWQGFYILGNQISRTKGWYYSPYRRLSIVFKENGELCEIY